MKKKLLFIATVALFWSACSTSEPIDAGFDTPVFSISMEIDSNTNTSLTAGKNSVYHFTRVDQGADSILVMSGAFADASCPEGNCPGSVKFVFRNEWQEDFVRPDVIFAADKFWDYKSPLDDSLSLEKLAVQWVLPDGTVLRSDQLSQPQDTFGSLSHFVILDSEPWEINERGETTWKMTIDFTCWMLDSIKNEEQKIRGSGVIAVGYR
ncbi:MAG: hypothetical protein ACKVT2_05750 [Saprospiraceae bacterium]